MNALLGSRLALGEPRWLLAGGALGALLVVLWLRAGRGRLPAGAVVARLLVVLALAVALAQPFLARPAPANATIFVVDRSRSMGGERQRAVEQQLWTAIATNAGRQPLGLVAFAERPVVLFGVGQLPATEAALTRALASADVGSPDATDITSALALAAALPTGGGGAHLVLFSDGRETLGHALDWAASAAGRGVTVDTVTPAGTPWPGDVRLAGVSVPESAWQGGDLDVTATLDSDRGGPATVTLSLDGRPAGQRTVNLQPGGNTYHFTLASPPPGYHGLRVEVSVPGGDVITANNALTATTVVRDRPRVLLVEGQPGASDELRRVLERASFEVGVRSPATLTGRVADLTAYDAIVLVDVPADALGADRQRALQEFVRSLGRGLVVTGGSNSFGRGGYAGSTLEGLLPVRVKPRGEGKRAPAALLLVIDRSYSMNFPEPGPSKIDMAKAAAVAAVRALSPGDQIAVLAFGDTNQWVTRLRTINGPADVNAVVDQISRLTADGETQMYSALRAAIDELAQSNLGTKHIVLLSDGEPTRAFDANELTARVRAAGLTLSTIAIGENAAVTLMEQLAQGGTGRYSLARRPDEIPKLTLEETQQLGGKVLATGRFFPAQTAPSAILRGLDPATLPPLDGYDITEVKPEAQTILASGKDEPVLAQWQYGLGRVVAWTSDLGQLLATQWRGTTTFATFWNQAVRWTLAAPASPYFRVRATPDGRDVVVGVDAFDATGAPVNLADTTTRLRTPTGATVALALPQTAPGHYEVRLVAPQPGDYRLDLTQTRGAGAVTDVAGFSVGYPAELREAQPDGAFLAALATRTGGRLDSTPAALLTNPRAQPASRLQPLWPWFAALALALFLVDIALRLGYTLPPATRRWRLAPRR